MSHAVRTTVRSRALAPRELPNYRLPEAAHYLRIPQSTLRTWIFGQAYGTAARQRRSHPLIKVAADDPPRLSFVNMIEAHDGRRFAASMASRCPLSAGQWNT